MHVGALIERPPDNPIETGSSPGGTKKSTTPLGCASSFCHSGNRTRFHYGVAAVETGGKRLSTGQSLLNGFESGRHQKRAPQGSFQ